MSVASKGSAEGSPRRAQEEQQLRFCPSPAHCPMRFCFDASVDSHKLHRDPMNRCTDALSAPGAKFVCSGWFVKANRKTGEPEIYHRCIYGDACDKPPVKLAYSAAELKSILDYDEPVRVRSRGHAVNYNVLKHLRNDTGRPEYLKTCTARRRHEEAERQRLAAAGFVPSPRTSRKAKRASGATRNLARVAWPGSSAAPAYGGGTAQAFPAAAMHPLFFSAAQPNFFQPAMPAAPGTTPLDLAAAYVEAAVRDDASKATAEELTAFVDALHARLLERVRERTMRASTVARMQSAVAANAGAFAAAGYPQAPMLTAASRRASATHSVESTTTASTSTTSPLLQDAGSSPAKRFKSALAGDGDGASA